MMQNIRFKKILLLIFFVGVTVVATPSQIFAAKCGDTTTSVISCNSTTDGEAVIWELLQTTIAILATGVGVLALAGIVYGAILYTSAGGNPEQVKKAKNIFVNVVIGVVAFAAMYTVIEFLIPGGVFN